MQVLVRTGQAPDLASALLKLHDVVEITMHDDRKVWLKWDRKKERLTIMTKGPEDDKPEKLGQW